MKRRRGEAAAIKTAAKGGEGRRIVSLLPSATEIVCALGLEDRLVGISHSCDYPPSITDRPRLSRARANLEGLSSGEIDAAGREALRDRGRVFSRWSGSTHHTYPATGYPNSLLRRAGTYWREPLDGRRTG